MSGVNTIQDLLKSGNFNNTFKVEEEIEQADSKSEVLEIALDLIEFDPEQPRQEIIQEEVEDIVRTLIPEGSKINQPITTWPKNKNGKYVIKFGEKRTRASRLAGKETIPVIIDERFDFDNAEHRMVNFAEQYVENQAKSGLTKLDDCVALAKLYESFGSLEKVKVYTGARSLGTISDKIKVSKIKTEAKFSFLLKYYSDPELKFKDLTTLRKLIDVFNKNEKYYDLIKTKVIDAVSEDCFNRSWVDALGDLDFEESISSLPSTKKMEVVEDLISEEEDTEVNDSELDSLTSKEINLKDKVELGYKVRPVKKVKLFGRVSLGRKKVRCQLLLDRLDDESGYVWVLQEGKEDPIRVNLSKLSLTEIL